MINFFKKLFAAIFGAKKKSSPFYEKPIKEEPIVLLDEMKMPKESYQPAPKKSFWEKQTFFPFTGSKKWQMRNNRLHIEYNGEAPRSSSNMFRSGFYKTSKTPRIIRAGAMYKGRIDSLKCNRLERAQEILKGLHAYIERAVFTDKDGNQHLLSH